MLFFNLDCTDFFGTHDTTCDGGAQVDRYVDLIIDGGVTHFLCNTQAECANYGSAVWEPFWTGYDPAGPDDQPYLAAAGEPGSKEVQSWRRLVDSMLNLHRQGIDYPARVLQRCRERGAAAWITLRMNDVHVQDNEAHPIHSTFWRDNPRLRRRGYTGYYAKALDYAHPEVRNYYRELIVETLERYDLDGLELDFMREPYLFSKGEEERGRKILTEWLREVRALVRATGERRGHPIQLSIRVPSRPEVCARFGLEPAAWAKEGLIDVLVPTPRWASLEFDIPIAEWRRLLEGTDVVLLGGLEVLYRPFRNAAQHGVTPAQARGAAAQFLASGADGIYLFNYFPSGGPAGETWWTVEEYPAVLLSLANLEELTKLPRSHAITCHDVTGPDGDENGSDQLPAKGQRLGLALPTGPLPKQDLPATLTLDLERRQPDNPEPPEVRINGGEPLELMTRTKVGAEQTEYPVPDGWLRYVYLLPTNQLNHCEPNRIEVDCTDEAMLLVLATQVNFG